MPETGAQSESLGRRIAAHRAKLGWTQQELADRLAISRVAVSHLEAGLSEPGERTVALLAGVFKLEPHELVAGTTYPAARADRLPVVVAMYTEVDLQLALFDAEMAWLATAPDVYARERLSHWALHLRLLLPATHDRRERAAVAAAQDQVRTLQSGLG